MKVAVVTGACKDGYGEAVTRRLLSDGYSVYGTYESELADKANSFKADNLVLFEVDHASRSSMTSFVEAIDKSIQIDALVNAQMYFYMEDPDTFNYDKWDKSLAINLTAPCFLFHALKGRMPPGASVVTITSTEGFIGSYGASSYAATKAAIHNLVKTHANLVGQKGIRVNALAPGWIGGVMDTDEVFNLSRKITPLGRLGSPKEVAAVVAFLLSDQASFINGTTIIADGGYLGVDAIAKYEFEASNNQG